MTDIKTLKQRLLDEAASRDIGGMSTCELEGYARMVNAIASIPEKSYTDYLETLVSANTGFGTLGGVSNG